jgi:hypothetical protein
MSFIAKLGEKEQATIGMHITPARPSKAIIVKHAVGCMGAHCCVTVQCTAALWIFLQACVATTPILQIILACRQENNTHTTI